MSVWDPEIVLEFKHAGEAQAAGEEWRSSPYELPPDEVLEVFRIEVIPPVDTSTNKIKKLRYVTLMADETEFDTIRINSIMMPCEHHANIVRAVDLGVPYLHRPITGVVPTPIEGTCPKFRRGTKLYVKVVPDENITSDDVYKVILKAARVRGLDKLREVIGGTVTLGFTLDGDNYPKAPLLPTLENFDELPGGLRQAKPQVFPWITYARNKVATTPNEWYEFLPDKVSQPWMQLGWNLVQKEVAYMVNYIGVIPHANSKAVRLFCESRITNPEFPTRPLPEYNYFMPAMFYDTTVNEALKNAGPRKLRAGYCLFHGVKGGIQVVDNGTAIPENGIEIMVYGKKFILK